MSVNLMLFYEYESDIVWKLKHIVHLKLSLKFYYLCEISGER